jgi:hypothetical protein
MAARKRPSKGGGKAREAKKAPPRERCAVDRAPPADRRLCKFDDHRKAAFLDKLRAGLRRGAAAEAVGVHRNTVSNAIRDDPDFAEAVSQAELDACELIEDALFKAATQDRNVTAIQVWLYNRWKDMRQAGRTDTLETLLAQLPADLGREIRQAIGRDLSTGTTAPCSAAGPPAAGA